MKQIKKIFWGLGLLALVPLTAPAQDKLGTVPTETMAPPLVLAIHQGGTGRPVKKDINSYRGKWLVLEFWGKYCVSCIEGFPHLEALRKQFSKEASFLLIGGNHPKYDTGIKEFYQRFRSEYGLGFDTAFDTLAFRAFAVRSTPIAIVISPEGRIELVTTGKQLDEGTLERLIRGSDSITAAAVPYDTGPWKNSDSSAGLAHSAQLSLAQGEMGRNLELDLSRARDGEFRTWPVSLERLYMLAHFSRALFLPSDTLASAAWPRPLLETRDSSLFLSSSPLQKNIYRYDLQMVDSAAGKKEMMGAMASDLGKWFPYRAALERRAMPVLKLVVTDSTLLKRQLSPAKASSQKGDASGYQLRGMTPGSLLRLLRKYLAREVLIDRTGTSGPIDLDIRANMTSPASISSALRPYGLDLVRASEALQVLVISDRQ